MANIKVAVINHCSALNNDDVSKVVAVLQKQVHQDFAPIWGIDADLVFVPRDADPPADHWWLLIMDRSDDPSLTGSHNLNPEGLPTGRVFAKSDMEKQLKWTVTASHELLEMLADPAINLSVFIESGSKHGKLYAYEVCDPCEGDGYGYEIDGVTVSNFVFPSWFEPFRKPGAQFDFQKKIEKAFQLLPGGYIGVLDIKSETGWQQISEHSQRSPRQQAHPYSRRERRRTSPASQSSGLTA